LGHPDEQGAPPADIVEEALAMALRLAVERRDLAAVQAVTAELRARREARAQIADLGTYRAGKGSR
jgi:hypothetical protein